MVASVSVMRISVSFSVGLTAAWIWKINVVLFCGAIADTDFVTRQQAALSAALLMNVY